MKAIKPLLHFAGKFLLIYILLISLANTTGLPTLYRNLYMNATSVVANNVYRNADIKCEKLDDDKTEDDIVFTFANKLVIEKAKRKHIRQGK